MEPSKQRLTARLVELLGQMFAQIRPRLPEERLDLELTMPQFRTLCLLSQGPHRMSDIADYLGSSLSSATSMIDRLVSKQLVERLHDPADRRVVTCHLTPLGRETVERFWRVHRQKVEMVAGLLTAQELQTVVQAMETLSAAIGRQGEGSPPGPWAASRGERGEPSVSAPTNP